MNKQKGFIVDLNPDVWLPTQSGGAKCKHLSHLTNNKSHFIRQTSNLNHQKESDRTRYLELAREWLFNDQEKEPYEQSIQ